MAIKVCFVVLLTLVSSYTLKYCQENYKDCEALSTGIVFLSQPRDMDVCIDTSAVIDCSYTGVDTLPSWLINSTSYTSFDLPPNHRYNGEVLTVNDVILQDNDTTYQCYFALHNSNGSLFEVRSNTGRLTVLTTSTCELRKGPVNITRLEGATNVFIPCPLSGFALPVWKVNGSFYEIYQLPEVFTPAYAGLNIPLVTREMNGTVFQCFTSNDHEYTVEASLQGILTVIYTDPKAIDITQNNYLYIDHQNMVLLDNNLKLAWKATISNDRCSSYEVIARHMCGYSSQPVKSWAIIDHLSVTIPRNRSDFNIVSTNNEDFACRRLKESIQIHESATTVDQLSSLSQSLKLIFFDVVGSPFYLVLPRSGSSDDCFCPIIFQTETCYSPQDCFCINDTMFRSSSLHVCLTDQAEGKFSFVIGTLTRELNNTLLYLFHGYYCDDDFIPPYRLYTHAFNIKIVLPEPPSINVDVLRSDICFNSTPVDGISIDSYEVALYDRTGEQTFIKNVDTSTRCIAVNAFQNQTCAPFSASVKAINSHGFSENIITVLPNVMGDTCSCLQNNVNINVSVINDTANEITVSVEYLVLHYTSNVEIDVRVGTNYSSKIVVNNTLILTIQNATFKALDCNKLHNVSLVWVSPGHDSNFSEGVECSLNHTNKGIRVICPRQLDIWIFVGIAIAVSSVIILIITVNVVIMLTIKHIKSSRNNYSVQY